MQHYINNDAFYTAVVGHCCCCCCCCRDTFEYLEDFPINLLHQLPKRTGRDVTELIVLNLQYGPNFSGPAKDVFVPDRAVGDPMSAHESNFLHPVFYYYKELPTGLSFMHDNYSYMCEVLLSPLSIIPLLLGEY